MSRRALDQTLSFIETIDGCRSADNIADALLKAVSPFGFQNILAGVMPTSGMTEVQQVANVVLHRWPDDWSQRYFSQDYVFVDPIVSRLTGSIHPFAWSDLTTAADAAGTRVMNEAREVHLGDGFTVPMLTMEGHWAGISLANDRIELPPESRGIVQMLAIYSFARALDSRPKAEDISLTARERDVLQWIAEGKTDWEISMILHVSEHLVDKMCRQLRTKLGATNRTHTVAFALRRNLIR